MQNSPPEGFGELEALGSSGSVYRAFDAGTGLTVHLRRVMRRAAALREARILRRVAGEFVPRLVALVPGEEGDYWLATEWVEGEPLHQAEALSAAWPAELMRMLCHIHRHDVVHGDLKPANIMRRRDGRLCLVDFGCALRTGEEPRLKESGGTPGFAAPERLTGWPADPRSDLYAFAQTVRALAPDTLGRHALVEQLGASSPAQRPATAAEALGRLCEWLGAGQLPAPDLRWAGWTSGTPHGERLARGLQAYLGVDAYVARKLMRLLLEIGGGAWSRTNALWRAWLPDICPDPWQGQSAETWLAGMRQLEKLGRRAARLQLHRLSPAARWLVTHQAQFVTPMDEAHRLPALSDFGSLRESSRFALMPAADHPLMSELFHADVLRVEPPADGQAHGSPRFATRILWEAALDALDEPTATALHAEIAAAGQARLESDGQPGPRQLAGLAWHSERARHDLAAMSGYARGAAQAYADHDVELGTRIFGDAVRLARRTSPGHPVELLVLRICPADLPEACNSAFQLVENYALGLSLAGQGLEAARWARALRRAAPDAIWLSRSWRAMAEVQFRRGSLTRALRCVERGLACQVPDPEITGGLLVHRAQALMSQRRLTECAATLEQILGMRSHASTDGRYVCHALMLRGLVAMRRARLPEARSDWLASLAQARAARVHPVVSSSYLNLSILDRVEGNEPSAVRNLEQALQVAVAHGIHRDVMAALTARAEFSLRRHDWAEGQRCHELCLRLALDINRRPLAARALLRLGRLNLRRGSLRSAELAMLEAQPLLGRAPHLVEQLQLNLELIELSVWYRRRVPEEKVWQATLSALQDWEGPREAAEMRVFGALRELLLGHTPREARRWLGREPAEPEVVGWYHLAAARVAGAEGEEGAMRISLDSALRTFRERRQGDYEPAFALLQAGLLEEKFDPRRALPHLEEAVRLSRGIASRWIDAQATVARHRVNNLLRSAVNSSLEPIIEPGRFSGRTL